MARWRRYCVCQPAAHPGFGGDDEQHPDVGVALGCPADDGDLAVGVTDAEGDLTGRRQTLGGAGRVTTISEVEVGHRLRSA